MSIVYLAKEKKTFDVYIMNESKGEFPKGVKPTFFTEVVAFDEIHRKFITTFKQRLDYSNNHFEGDLNDMIKLIIETIITNQSN